MSADRLPVPYEQSGPRPLPLSWWVVLLGRWDRGFARMRWWTIVPLIGPSFLGGAMALIASKHSITETIGFATSIVGLALWFAAMWRNQTRRIGSRSIAAMIAAYPEAVRIRMIDEHRRWRAYSPAEALTLSQVQSFAWSAEYAIEREKPPRADARASALRQDRAFDL